jgi:hypothetical protein
MKKQILLSVSLLILGIVFATLFSAPHFFSLTPAFEVDQKPRSVNPRVKMRSEIEASDIDAWEDWLREIEDSAVGEPATERIAEVVGEGETMISKGWEGPDGRIHFTFVTPTPHQLDDGRSAIMLTTQEVAIDLSGQQDQISAPSLLTLPGQPATIEISGADGFSYRLTMNAKPVPGTSDFFLGAEVSRAMPAPKSP